MQTHNEVCKEQEFPKADGVTPLHSAAARGQLNSKSQKKSPGDYTRPFCTITTGKKSKPVLVEEVACFLVFPNVRSKQESAFVLRKVLVTFC